MKKVYPVILTPEDDWYIVDVPDFDISTQGHGLAEAIDMARDAINLMGVDNEDRGIANPEPTSMASIKTEPSQICTLVDCDFDEYRLWLENRSVKKNCTLPSWLNKKAEAANINFSAVLQKALMQELNIER